MRISPAVVLTFPLLSFACSATDEGAALEARFDEPPADISAGTHLTSLRLPDGRTVHFYESRPGLVTVGELGPLGQTPVVKGLESKTLSEVFQTLAPNLEIPQALIDAEAREQGLPLAEATIPPPQEEGEVPARARGLSVYTVEQHDWFRGTFCRRCYVGPVARDCLLGWDWANSGTMSATDFDTAVFVGSEATNSGRFTAQHWECDSFLGVQYNCGWRRLLDARVNPGFWSSWGSHRGGWYNSALSLEGGTGTVGLMAAWYNSRGLECIQQE